MVFGDGSFAEALPAGAEGCPTGTQHQRWHVCPLDVPGNKGTSWCPVLVPPQCPGRQHRAGGQRAGAGTHLGQCCSVAGSFAPCVSYVCSFSHTASCPFMPCRSPAARLAGGMPSPAWVSSERWDLGGPCEALQMEDGFHMNRKCSFCSSPSLLSPPGTASATGSFIPLWCGLMGNQCASSLESVCRVGVLQCQVGMLECSRLVPEWDQRVLSRRAHPHQDARVRFIALLCSFPHWYPSSSCAKAPESRSSPLQPDQAKVKCANELPWEQSKPGSPVPCFQAERY